MIWLFVERKSLCYTVMTIGDENDIFAFGLQKDKNPNINDEQLIELRACLKYDRMFRR